MKFPIVKDQDISKIDISIEYTSSVKGLKICSITVGTKR